MSGASVSVIVCTYNRSRMLMRMLRSFFAQDALDAVDYEIIVVDNHSTDGTRETVESFGHIPQLRYVFAGIQGLSFARNRGVAESQGQIVAFLDDDVIVDRGWLSGLVRCYAETAADVVGGRSTLIFEGERPPWLGPDFLLCLSQVELGPERRVVADGKGLYGLNLSLCRHVLERAGGFDEALGRQGALLLCGEETRLLRRLADPVILYEPHARVGHIIGPERLQWDYYVRCAEGYGRTMEEIEPRCGLPWQVLRLLRSAWRCLKMARGLTRARRQGADTYEAKRAEWALLCEKSLLKARWKRLGAATSRLGL